ncbi:hypothetical protein GGI17_000691 [Coemansia sp. S146]|nr:hypothetical protein GGI17_000691 [Coemansia sp. S146]
MFIISAGKKVGRVIRARLSRKRSTASATSVAASTDTTTTTDATLITALIGANIADTATNAANADAAFEDVTTSTNVANADPDAAVDDPVTTALTRAALIKTRSRRIATSIKSAINHIQHILSDVENVLEMAEHEKLQAASDLPGIVDISATYDCVHDAISDLCWVSEDETDLIKYLPLFLELHPEAELMAAKWIAECARSYYMVLVVDIAMADKGLVRICQLAQAARNAAKGAAIREEQLRMLAAEQTKWGINIF